MIKLFRYIRRQPKHVRDNYAMGIAVSFTAVVFVFWGVTKMSEGITNGVLSKTDAQVPFATLIKQTKEQFASIKDSMSGSTSQTASVSEAVEEVVTETNPANMVLSQEDIEIANQNSTTSESGSTSGAVQEENSTTTYKEVMIGTTTTSVSKEVDNSADSGPADTATE